MYFIINILFIKKVIKIFISYKNGDLNKVLELICKS